MPMGTPATFRGTVQADPAVVAATFRGTVAGFVAGGFVGSGFVAPAPPTFRGTVDCSRVAAYDAPMIYAGVRVVLDGVEIPREHLVGPVTLRGSIDSHLTSGSLQLAGREYSLHATTATWTRAPIEIWFAQGPPGGVLEELRLEGVVRTCRETDHEGEPVLEVQISDLSARYDRYRLCHEVPPYSGLTRGAIAREVCLDAGIALTDIPEGAVYDAPLQLDGDRLFPWLQQWGEPEGWHWRWDGDTLQAYVPELLEPPQVPDHVWTPREIETLESEPPQDPPSRYVVRGYAALYVDEVGIETEVTRTEVRQLYAPAGAVERQNADGTRTPVDFTQPEAERVTQILIDTTQRRGTRELRQETEEWAWHNLAAAKGETVTGPGTSGLGWNYTVVYIDTEGRFVYYPVERFGVVGRRERIPGYDGAGTRVSEIERQYRHHRRTHGIRQTGIGGGDPQTAGVGIGDDDESYLIVTGDIGLEAFGLAEEFQRAFAYHSSGAALREDQDEYGYRSPRVALDVAGAGHRVYSGSAQRDLVAGWIRVGQRTKINLLSQDARLRGTIETASGYRALRKHDGAHEFGGAYSSHEVEERFRRLEGKRVAYIVRGHHQVEEVTYTDDGERQSRLLLGPLPTPGFLSSPWVELVQEPLELIVDDPTVEEWFGVSQESIDNPFIQNLAEAELVLRNRRRRDLPKRVVIGRAETVAREGDTVLVVWPPLIAERYLLVGWEIARDPITGAADARYTLEHPL